VDLIADDWSKVEPVPLGLHLASALRKLYPNEWNPKNFDRLLVHRQTFEAVVGGKPVLAIVAAWQPELENYRERRRAYLLYEE
jgi:hypothetical protein